MVGRPSEKKLVLDRLHSRQPGAKNNGLIRRALALTVGVTVDSGLAPVILQRAKSTFKICNQDFAFL